MDDEFKDLAERARVLSNRIEELLRKLEQRELDQQRLQTRGEQ